MKIEQFVGLAKGYFNDNLYTGDQVNPQSIDKIEEIIKDLDITLDMVFPLLKRSLSNELELVVEPNPIAYSKSLTKSGFDIHGVVIFVEDKFIFNGTCTPYEHQFLNKTLDIAGVALHVHDIERKTDLYRFIPVEQLNTANEWFILHGLGGIKPKDQILRALSLSVAIRHTIKWLMPQYIDRDFSAYQQLVELHTQNSARQPIPTKEEKLARRYRRISNEPSKVELLLSCKEEITIFTRPAVPHIENVGFYDF
jgi:hypothetical protein